MRKRISTLIVAVLAVAAFGGAAGVANAKHGADDPVGHARHGGGADDGSTHVRHSGADDARKARRVRRSDRRHGNGHRRHSHGRDDRAGHVRHGRGTDDGSNHS